MAITYTPPQDHSGVNQGHQDLVPRKKNERKNDWPKWANATGFIVALLAFLGSMWVMNNYAKIGPLFEKWFK